MARAKTIVFLCVAGLIFLTAYVQAEEEVAGCGSLENAYGPYDYTNPDDFAKKLPIVEHAHFTSSVENLIRGHKGTIESDLDYTLRAFPNHHRALYAMALFQLRTPYNPRSGYYSIECYFQRATQFKPGDGTVRMLNGIYLHKKGAKKEALAKYQEALKIMPDSPDLNYNFGLLYFDEKNYDLAAAYAKKAYARGYPLPGLKNNLGRIGLWQEASDAGKPTP